MRCLAFLLTMLGLCLPGAQNLFAGQAAFPTKKLAVLKISYVDFSPQEKDLVNAAFYKNLGQNQNLEILTESEAYAQLLLAGLDPEELNENGYLQAGRALQADYVLVGKMEKVGDFVEVTFRLFTMPRGAQKEYPGGKTMDMFIKQEIPQIVALIHCDLAPATAPVRTQNTSPTDSARTKPAATNPRKKPAMESLDKKKKLPWLAIGGAAVGSGIVAALLLSSGGEAGNPPPTNGLPRPPKVP